MKDELITYPTAVLAKEKGFPQEEVDVFHFYTKPRSKMFGIDEKGRYYPTVNTPKRLYTIGENAALNIENVFNAPTQSLLQRWLREEHKIDIHVAPSKSGYWFEVLYNNNLGNFDEISNDEVYDTYEQALEAGFFKALQLIK